MNDRVFKGYGRLIFPVDQNISQNMRLKDIEGIMTWYSYVNTDKTVEIVNDFRSRAASGQKIFYSIYSDAEKEKHRNKRNTGVFFFSGKKGAKTAIVNAGGGFMYVGAMHDSFPQALELSKKGYNAFALIYRPGAETACEDLSRAISFLFDHQKELGISMADYSLWGGSAGGRMADWVGTYGTKRFGERENPRPAAVITQYTGLREVTGKEPSTYACVGTADYIADYRTIQRRIQRIRRSGTDAEIEVFRGLPHGFGLGQGTAAEGWINRAVKFWERNMQSE